MKEQDIKRLQEEFRYTLYDVKLYIDSYRVKQINAEHEILLDTVMKKLNAISIAIINIEERLKYHEDRHENLIKELAGINE